MRDVLAMLLATVAAACTRKPELVACNQGAVIDSIEHSISIDGSGRVSIDDARCGTQREVQEALDAVVKAMPSNVAIAARLGLLHVPDAPFAVRIDESARFADAAWWLAMSQQAFRIFRTRLAVRDPASDAERFLVLDHVLRADPGCSPVDFDPVRFWGEGTYLLLEASDHPSWNKSIERTPAWKLSTTAGDDVARTEPRTWAEVREAMMRFPNGRCIVISGALPPSTPWRDLVPIIAEALERWHADVTFSAAAGPTLR